MAYLDGRKIDLFIHLDATSSGAQLIASWTLDITAAWQANLFSVENQEIDRENLYNWCYTNFKEFCASCGQPLPDKLGYKQIKNEAIMPWFYGSDKAPKETFGKSHKALFDIFMAKNFPGLAYMHSIMIELWDKKKAVYSWHMPDGGFCECPTFITQNVEATFNDSDITVPCKVIGTKDNGRALGAHMAHATDAFILREVERSAHPKLKKNAWIKRVLEQSSDTYVYPVIDNKALTFLLDIGKASGFYSLRIIEAIKCEYDIHCVPRHILEELLSQFAPVAYDIMPIHDCFMVRPDMGNLVREAYIYNLYKLAHSEKFASWLMSAIAGKEVTCKEFYANRYEFAQEILRTCDYAIC